VTEIEAEIVPPHRERERVSASIPVAGALFAGGTVIAAAAVMALMIFGKVLLVSAIVTWIWPRVFSPEFTAWVFGTAVVPYWKILLLCLLATFSVRWLTKKS